MQLTESIFEKEKTDLLKDYVVVGIDIGSRQSKAVLLTKNEIYTVLRPTGFNMKETANELLDDLYLQSNLTEKDIDYYVCTGYGRVSIELDNIPGRIMTEIACHGMGAHFLGHNIRTIIDIGGQDSKVIKIDPENGSVKDFAMNDKCAAGTGRFLEKIADVLGLDVTEIGPVSLKAERSKNVNAQCIVFAESEVISARAEGVKTEDIAAGIHDAVARRVYGLLNRVGIQEGLLFTGGVANNVGIRAAFEKLLGFKISVAKMDTVYAGALGAAVFANKFAESSRGSGAGNTKRNRLDLTSLEGAVSEQKKELISHKKKNVGYVCAYMPVEILGASDVNAIRLFEAGNQAEIMAGESITQSVLCDLTKSIIGGFITGNPVQKSLDHVYTFFTCDCMRKSVEAIDSEFIPATLYNLPRQTKDLSARSYYVTELKAFKKDLETLTGSSIDDNEIYKSIADYNLARRKIRQISDYRKKDLPLVTGSDFQKIARSYYQLPVKKLLHELDGVLEQLENADDASAGGGYRPRIMVSGGIIGDGDNKITEILESLGADVVVEDNCTGIKPFQHDIPEHGNWAKDLADGYMGQAPCGRMKPLDDMLYNSLELAKQYKAQGVVLYFLKFCPCYSMMLKKYNEIFKKENIPVLIVSSDYSHGDDGQIKIRIEAFLEMLSEGVY